MSKDPATKAQVVQMLAQSGLVNQDYLTQVLEVPDVDTTYSYMQNRWNAVQTTIDQCIFGGKFEIPPFVDLLLLSKEIVNTQLFLFNANPVKNIEDINSLTKLFQLAYEKNEEYAKLLQQPSVPTESVQA